MTYQLSDDNLAYKLRQGNKYLLTQADKESKNDTLLSTHRADYKTPPRSSLPEAGKKRQLMERYLFHQISKDLAEKEFRIPSPPKYVSTTHDHFDVPGFDPDASLRPRFDYSLYRDPAITYWSENKRGIHGVTLPNNQMRNFNYSAEFSKPVEERWENSLTYDK